VTRRRSILLAAAILVVAMVSAGLWYLPEFARRMAVEQVIAITGRQATIEDVDLNLFTGSVAVKGFRLAEREGQGSEPFMRFERLEARLFLPSLVLLDVRLRHVGLTGLDARVIRTGESEFNFSDILAHIPRREPSEPKPSRFSVTFDRVGLTRTRVRIEDRTVTPTADWSLQSLDAEALSVTTREGSPGRGTLRLRSGEASVEFDKAVFQLSPLAVSLTVKLSGMDLTRVVPYIRNPDLALEGGVLSATLDGSFRRVGGKVEELRVGGEVGLERFAISHSETPGRSISIARLGVGIGKVDLLARTAALSSVAIEGADIGMVRRSSGQIDILQAIGRFVERRAAAERERVARDRPAPSAGAPPAPAEAATAPTEAPAAPASPPAPAAPSEREWLVKMGRITIGGSRVQLLDEAVSPPAQWRLEELAVNLSGLSTSGDEAPATGEVKGRLGGPGQSGLAALVVNVERLRSAPPLAALARVSLTDFDLAALNPYVPSNLPDLTTAGLFTTELELDVARKEGTTDLALATATGSVRFANLVLARRGAAAPMLKLPQLAVAIKKADVVARSVELGTLEIDGVDARVTRDPNGSLDVVRLLDAAKAPGAPGFRPVSSTVPRPSPSPPAATGATAPAPAAAPAWSVSLDRFALKHGGATFDDQAVTPATVLTVSDLTVTARRLRWPTVRGAAPGSLRITAGLPGGGLFLVEGRASLDPLDMTFQISTLDAPIEPYAAYFPFPARFKGLFSGDSLNTVKIENGKLLAASQGNAYAKQIQVVEPGAEQPAVTLERMEIREIDFAWPNYAFVRLVTLSRPEIRVERAADGSINLRRMFASPGKPSDREGPEKDKTETKKEEAKKPTTEGGGEGKKPGLMETMVLDFDQIVVDEGYMRFLDNTTKPAFSQDVGRLAVTIRNLSNTRDGRRSTLAMQGIVGGDSALDMRGELSRLGDDFFADLVGELRDFSVASANPYAESMLAWFVKQGKLGLRVHYRIEHDRLTGENEIVVKDLQVAKGPESDEVQKRIGLPLGLIVAVLKDSQGDISFQVPISGSLSDRQLDWSETIWSAVKQVLVKALASPFNAIGRLFTGGGGEKDEKVQEVKVDPVTFPAGSSVIGPAMEGHLDRVGEFLRKSPFVNLTLSPVATAKDLESLKGQELTAKIQRIQRERGIPNYARAVTVHYREQGIEGPVPPSAEEQLKVLQAREVVPEVRVKEMLDRRASGTRDLLVKGEGIPAERLRPGQPRTLPAEPTDGRVEFAISAE
jgi:hypothetical protein